MGDPARQLEPEDSEPTGHLKPAEGGVYDAPGGSPSQPGLTVHPGGGESTPREKNHLSVAGETPSRGEIANKEASAASSASGKVDSAEKSFIKNYDEKARGLDGVGAAISASPVGKFASIFFKNRKRQTATGAAVVTLGVGVFMFSILQGPFQGIHFSQLLQKFHLRSNEDFGNNRASKVMLYALAGFGAERGKLTSFNNSRADKWEDRLVRDTGMRPLYSNITGRLVAYEIVNRDKAFQALANISDEGGKKEAAVERALGQGAEIKPIQELDSSKQSVRRTAKGGGSKPPNGTVVLSLQETDFKTRRLINKTLLHSTNTFNVAAANGSRLLKKRGGINFSVFEGKGFRQWLDKQADKRDTDENREKYKEEQRKKRRAYIKGAKAGIVATALGKSQEEVKKGVEEARAAAEAEGGEASREVSKNLAKGAGALFVVGVFCSAKDVGGNVAGYKYEESAVQMMKMGMLVTSGGDGTRAGKAHLDELGVDQESFYDEESKTSWDQANTIRSELGQKPINETKYNLPKEAQLKNIHDKPFLFDAVDAIPLLGPACSALDAAINAVPGAEAALGAAADAAVFGADQALGLPPFNTSVEELTEKAISSLAGQTVNDNAQGAEFGNLANTGVLLAANDQARSMGGRALEPTEVAELRNYEQTIDKQEMRNKSFAQRYLDIYDRSSLVGSAVANAPRISARSSFAYSANPFGFISSMYAPKVHAAVNTKSVYGVAKYGFSLSEQDSIEFEDPYKNAAWVEPRLDELNEKYGPCFGMRVIASDNRISIESASEGDDEVNIFKVQENENCRGVTGVASATTSTGKSSAFDWLFKKVYAQSSSRASNPELLRYRYYLADAVTSVSLACYEGEEQACAELGVAEAVSSPDETTISGEGGARVAAVAEKEYEKNGNKELETCGENCGPEVQKYTGGPSGTGAPWCAWFVSWVYREAGYEFKGAPAGADGNIPYVGNLVAWFKQHGIHYTPSSTQYKPEPGDVVMYGGDTHAGIVVKVNGDNIETVEGNTSGDGSFNANGETVGRKSFNYKNYSSRSIEFGRLK